MSKLILSLTMLLLLGVGLSLPFGSSANAVAISSSNYFDSARGAGTDLLAQDDATETDTLTPTATDTDTPEATDTETPTATETASPSASDTSTFTPAPSNTNTPTATNSYTPTPTSTFTPTPTASASPSATNTPSSTPIPTKSATPSTTPTRTPSATPSPIPTKTATPTSTPTRTPTVTPTPGPPSIDLNGNAAGTGYETSFVSGKPAVTIVGADLSITVPRGPNLSSAVVTIQNIQDGAAEILDAKIDGTTISKSYSAGVLRLQGIAPRTDYEKVLRTVTYRNTAAVPALATRKVSFVVNDGYKSSSAAISTIYIQYLRLSLQITPAEQTVAKGGTAVFTMTIHNAGNVTLKNVLLRDSLAPNCNRNWSAIDAGKITKISCSAPEVQADFVNLATLTGKDADGNSTAAQASSRVEVENPNIRIVKGPSNQTVLVGGTATFSVFVLNTSNLVNLGDVEVVDEFAPDCDRQGAQSLGNLAAGKEVNFNCKLENVTAPFTNEITVTARNLFTDETVSDSSVAAVDVLDMQATLQADPMLLVAPGGPVNFSLTLTNTGSVPWEVSGLQSQRFGSILDAQNDNLSSNDCPDKALRAVAPQEQFSCAFKATVTGTSGPNIVDLLATAVDQQQLMVQVGATVTLTLADKSELQLSLSSPTNSVAPPGAYVTQLVSITNPSQGSPITVSSLEHSQLLDLNGVGTCRLPQEIGGGDTYSCSYQLFIGGPIGTVIRNSLVARGFDAAGQPIGDEAELSFVVYDPNKLRSLLPIITSSFVQTGEDNDYPCAAYDVLPGSIYSFYIDDQEDWYAFNVERPGVIRVSVQGFIADDPQLVIYRGPDCSNLNIGPLAFDGSPEPNKSLSASTVPGMHYIRIVNPSAQTFVAPYMLLVETP